MKHFATFIAPQNPEEIARIKKASDEHYSQLAESGRVAAENKQVQQDKFTRASSTHRKTAALLKKVSPIFERGGSLEEIRTMIPSVNNQIADCRKEITATTETLRTLSPSKVLPRNHQPTDKVVLAGAVRDSEIQDFDMLTECHRRLRELETATSVGRGQIRAGIFRHDVDSRRRAKK